MRDMFSDLFFQYPGFLFPCTEAIAQVILKPALLHGRVLPEKPRQQAGYAPRTTAVRLPLPQMHLKKTEYFS